MFEYVDVWVCCYSYPIRVCFLNSFFSLVFLENRDYSLMNDIGMSLVLLAV